ncbi:tetratricopeptide repeat protein [Domibacillus tundrae]|uniref:tetratricopeptide repeat protein n=1 Tax=Domibacillus tundrae TaxID=1587527 RepID=UPI003CCBB86C
MEKNKRRRHMDKNQQGIELLQEGKWEEALKLFTEQIEEKPQDPAAYINFGHVLAEMNDTERALKFYEKAVEVDHSSSAAHYALGSFYFGQERFEEAAQSFEKAIRNGMEEADAYFMLGLSFLYLDQTVMALPYLMRAVELNGDDVEARFQFALVLAKTEQYEEAEKNLQVVISQDPAHADAFYNLGVLYAGHYEQPEKAHSYFDRALDIQPDHMLAGYGKKLLDVAN